MKCAGTREGARCHENSRGTHHVTGGDMPKPPSGSSVWVESQRVRRGERMFQAERITSVRTQKLERSWFSGERTVCPVERESEWQEVRRGEQRFSGGECHTSAGRSCPGLDFERVAVFTSRRSSLALKMPSFMTKTRNVF